MSTLALHAPGLAHRFGLVVDGLCRAMAARMARPRYPSDRAAHPLLMLLWSRLRRTMLRFTRAAERAAAGVARRPRPARPATRPAAGPVPARPPSPPRHGSAWLFRLVPEAPVYGSQLSHLLADPGMADLMRASPELVRLLRPLCRLLAVPDAARLLPPRPPRVAPAEAAATAAATPATAREPAPARDDPDPEPAPDPSAAARATSLPDRA